MDLITTRAVVAEYYQRMRASDGMGWVNQIANMFGSDQASETYAWLGMPPAMREVVGGRLVKELRENGYTIANKHFEATIKILIRDHRRAANKTPQAFIRIAELAQRAQTHWASLLSTLILNGPSTACYDGQYFFDTDHSEGDSGNQSNDISVDISELPVATAGTVTAPSVEEMQQAILKGVTKIQSFVDDQGEPMNEDAMSFLVMVPPGLAFVAMNALAQPLQTGVTTQRPIAINIQAVQNARLSSWTDKFVVFRTDGEVKPLIRQSETDAQMSVLGEGSDYAYDNFAYKYGVDSWRNVGYGLWQQACLVTLI